ncbi:MULTISPECIES: YbfB/YjiJ family MFS transporter [Rhodopseudomonas]|uniref:Sugar transporter n=1 Tax=Rhodopseudomonas palustris TaxID=1076 RepID=A0A0D7EWB5_RHOPL|nr:MULTISPECIES: YbfB/YjiJ family MFS transporter [Rhodopseudomonas]KIZ43712.1 sugar transporter [Rhodopseudomonas palustris]MDF3810309.1 YbfB/YjiJ family MFS transporter [Rhodopseudomonas sp. BAL398]WOK20199.1 YbfB/YjiJ family MFS transporter [Rhodopseudomonas sp. BAL398]
MRRTNQLAAAAAALTLVVGMGFGRFAFTGLYPLMVADGQISLDGGSYAASANYAGYLIGALLAGVLTRISSRQLCAWASATTIIMLGVLALANPEWLIVAIRGLAGGASAVAMVAASHWLIHDRRHHHGAPTLFAGVGIGILVSAEIIAAGHAAAISSRANWLTLAIAALVIGAIAVTIQFRIDRTAPHDEPHDAPAAQQPRAAAPPFGAARLVVIYGLAGFGYIITATYLPLLVRSALGSLDPVHVWAIFGLGAAPSCFIWHALHHRWGTRASLMVNLALQAIGVALPVLHSPVAYIGSALLVGGTFMGTVTIVMPAARRLAATQRFSMLAVLTAAYGVGQIIGPLIASAIHGRTQSFDASLGVAAIALVVAASLCLGANASRRPMAGSK